MTHHIYKTLELTGSSPVSIEDAVKATSRTATLAVGGVWIYDG